MGFRMRKSFKVAPGVRLNVSKRGVGASVGGGGVRYSAHSSGRRTVSARTGIPGVSYEKSSGGGRRRRRQRAPEPPPPPPRKPGFFAPRGEKDLYKAVKAQDPQAMRRAGDEHERVRVAAYSLAGLMLRPSDPAVADQLLTAVLESGELPEADRFLTTYVSAQFRITIADGIEAELPISRDAVALTLAEIKQDAGDLPAAIDLVEGLEPSTYAAVSLAELYRDQGRWQDVINLTDGLENEDDASALLLVFRGRALREVDLHDAAHEALKQALRARSRAAEIRLLALLERSENHLARGKTSMAKKDLERILAEDAGYSDARERLEALA